MTDSVPSFSDRCREMLAPFLAQYGYSYEATYCRPRGIALEFEKGKNCLFAVCEGDVLYVDLILHHVDEQYFRVSLNQALWFNNVRSLVGVNSCDAQMDVFMREVAAADCCRQFLSDDRPTMDDRYCFPMTTTSRQRYVSAQRGA